MSDYKIEIMAGLTLALIVALSIKPIAWIAVHGGQALEVILK